jgi:hypothetical protein
MNALASLLTFGTDTIAASRPASAFTLAVIYVKAIAAITMSVTAMVRTTGTGKREEGSGKGEREGK